MNNVGLNETHIPLKVESKDIARDTIINYNIQRQINDNSHTYGFNKQVFLIANL